ncbi:MFS transporter [Corynebacterium lizhenjunii]|uniref:MFS transporter n=1 Tax=Corynebacterium lizhenjunii TaxID=2709394 RepID=UPI0013EA3EAF|nr:MFS transporter [Corynebacterium lizhenjunii]
MSNLKNTPGYQRLVGTMALNQSAYAMAAVAIPLLVFDVSGNATLTGTISGLSTAALVVLSLPAGALTDTFHASTVLRLVTLTQAILWLGIAAMVGFGATSLLVIAGCAIVATALSAFDAPSEQSLIQQIVAPDDFGTANAIAHGRESAAAVIGGPVAGFLYSLAPAVCLAVQSCLHGLASVLVPNRKLADAPAPSSDESSPSLAGTAAEGFRFVFNHPGLRWITVVAAIANVPMSAFILLLIFSYRDAGASAFVVGLISAAFSAGVIAGSFFAGPLTKRVPLGKLGTMALAAFTAELFMLTLVHDNTAATIVTLFAAGLPLASFNSAIGAFTAAVTPEGRMGSVTTASTVPGIFLMPAGAILAGFGFEHWGTTASLAVISTLALVSTALTFVRPLQRIPLLTALNSSGS